MNYEIKEIDGVNTWIQKERNEEKRYGIKNNKEKFITILLKIEQRKDKLLNKKRNEMNSKQP
jgi:hypothetical protein